LPGTPARTPRDIEYDIFARVTHRLKALPGAAEGRRADLAAALHANRQLWTALAADVASPGNALAPELRARLFYLYEFTERHSRKVLAGEATVEVLIDINTSVMRGLRGEGGRP
jgi:flagellar protein FlaF